MWYVYLLHCADTSLYCGITTDMMRRLEAHNGLRAGGAKYTRTRRPVSVAACVAVSSRSEALRLEAAVRRVPRGRKQTFLLAQGEEGRCLQD